MLSVARVLHEPFRSNSSIQLTLGYKSGSSPKRNISNSSALYSGSRLRVILASFAMEAYVYPSTKSGTWVSIL